MACINYLFYPIYRVDFLLFQTDNSKIYIYMSFLLFKFFIIFRRNAKYEKLNSIFRFREYDDILSWKLLCNATYMVISESEYIKYLSYDTKINLLTEFLYSWPIDRYLCWVHFLNDWCWKHDISKNDVLWSWYLNSQKNSHWYEKNHFSEIY